MSGDRASRIASIEYDYAAQPKERVGVCNLCGSHAHVGLAHRDRYGFEAETVACLRCGLIFLDPRLAADAYSRFYEHVYRSLVSAYHGRRIETVEEEQATYAETLVGLLEPHLVGRRVPRLLDVGGSTGVVSQAVSQSFGSTATVIDPAPGEVARARARGLDAVVGTMESYAYEGVPFSLVLMCQTIDHLLDVSAVLGKVRALVAEDGLLFVDIVDFRASFLRAWSVEEATKIDHPYCLTEDTAETYLVEPGSAWSGRSMRPITFTWRTSADLVDPAVDTLPPHESVRELLREVRLVQNTSHR